MCVAGVRLETENDSKFLSFEQCSHHTNAFAKTSLVDKGGNGRSIPVQATLKTKFHLGFANKLMAVPAPSGL